MRAVGPDGEVGVVLIVGAPVAAFAQALRPAAPIRARAGTAGGVATTQQQHAVEIATWHAGVPENQAQPVRSVDLPHLYSCWRILW